MVLVVRISQIKNQLRMQLEALYLPLELLLCGLLKQQYLDSDNQE